MSEKKQPKRWSAKRKQTRREKFLQEMGQPSGFRAMLISGVRADRRSGVPCRLILADQQPTGEVHRYERE